MEGWTQVMGKKPIKENHAQPNHQYLGVRRLESEQQEGLLGDLAGRDLT